MGRLIAIVVLLAACQEHGSPGQCGGDAGLKIGDQFPKGDGCNVCTCTEHGVVCSEISCFDGGSEGGLDGPPPMCEPTGACTAGPSCGGGCCAQGEQCVGGACMCGGQMACTNGNTCQFGGPVGVGFCGSICCGGTSPCPIAAN